ncbi:MAG: hypothetical protein V3V99_10000 [candidate division Zixibacteria bacterium]
MAEIKINLTAREDLLPKCPFCEKETTELYTKSKGIPWIEGKNIIYFCPHCLKILGIGQSRMM